LCNGFCKFTCVDGHGYSTGMYNMLCRALKGRFENVQFDKSYFLEAVLCRSCTVMVFLHFKSMKAAMCWVMNVIIMYVAVMHELPISFVFLRQIWHEFEMFLATCFVERCSLISCRNLLD